MIELPPSQSGICHCSLLIRTLSTMSNTPNDKPYIMNRSEFLRLYELRAHQIMWFLGAGTSSAAGIPTATDMIWDFKRRLFCSEQGLPRAAVADSGNGVIRDRIQLYLNETHKYPEEGSEQEYSDYFEATFASASDRRQYLKTLMEDATPSYGHTALAALMKAGKVQIVWTTNFDKLVEDAAVKAFGTLSKTIVADLGEPEKATEALQKGSWPLIVKLHGDFHSIRLMNTGLELQKADEEMRSCLIDSCTRYGLAVVGYSGRDQCVIDALQQGINGGKGFPGGLFWFKRSGSTMYENALNLITTASENGIDAHIIELETFDELLDSLIRFLPDLNDAALELAKTNAPILSSVPLRRPSQNIPVLRSNALPILSTPTICRLIKCQIGGQREVAEALDDANLPILAQRCKSGVLSFGSDTDLKNVFDSYDITEFDTYAIEPSRLKTETGEKRLLFDALTSAIQRSSGFLFEHRRNRVFVLANQGINSTDVFNERKAGSLPNLAGTIGDTSIKWCEACELSLDYRLNRLWLLFEPTVLILNNQNLDQAFYDVSKEFVRQRTLKRYNQQYNSILSGWIKLLFGESKDTMKLTSLGITDGIDASFEVSPITGFSGATR